MSNIQSILNSINHPEKGMSIVECGFIENIIEEENKITIVLNFHKVRDPFSVKIKKQVEEILKKEYPQKDITVYITEKSISQERKAKEDAIEKMHSNTTTANIKHVIVIASGKGGVGKSTVTSNLAISLSQAGYRVGVLDADIYGPSQAKMLGVEDFIPDAQNIDGVDYIIPAENYGIKIMSIAMFIKKEDALLWRGTMANSALRQLIHQTQWGELDFLLIDLPPGTGDIHLSIINELKIHGAIIVSTPQQVAVDDVRRGVELFRNDNVKIPVLGIIENMAWFTPKELPDNKYYIFGHGGAKTYAKENNIDILGEVPIIQEVMQGAEDGVPGCLQEEAISEIYSEICSRVVKNLSTTC